MKLVFSITARRDVAEAVAYISADSRAAALRPRRLIEQTAKRLLDFPRLGRAGDDDRRWMHVTGTPYTLVYRQDGNVIVILRVWHGARGNAG